MGIFSRIFGKKKVATPFLSTEGNTIAMNEHNGYDPTDMLDPLNPLSPLSPFWIGDIDSSGDTHEFLQNDVPDATQNEVEFGGGSFGGGGSWDETPSIDDDTTNNFESSSSSYDSSSSSDSVSSDF